MTRRAQPGRETLPLRVGAASAGMRLGGAFKFVAPADMQGLDAQRVAACCDDVVMGRKVYKGLLYLGRAGPGDVAALLEASQHDDLQRRWSRLWVLSPYLARLARSEAGRRVALEFFAADIAGLHMVSRFLDHGNKAVVRLFERLREPLLDMLLRHLHEQLRQPRRTTILVDMIGAVSRDEALLRQRIAAKLGAGAEAALLPMLQLEEQVDLRRRKLDTSSIRERLEALRTLSEEGLP